MISIHFLSLVSLVWVSTAQQAQLVYDQHFVQPTQLPHQQQQPHYANQNIAPNSVPHGARTHPPPSQSPNIAMFPPSQPNHGQIQQQNRHPYPPPQHAQSQIQMPMAHGQRPQMPAPTGMVPQPIPHGVQRQGHARFPHHHQGKLPAVPPGAIPVHMPAPNEFASRRGPISKMIHGAKRYFPRKAKKRRRSGPPIRLMEMNRLPKPPKYPLYDMPDMGLATPPPPPLMSPMTGAATNMFSTFVHPPRHSKRGGRPPGRGKKPPRRRPPKHRGPPRPPKHRAGPHGRGGHRGHQRRPNHGNQGHHGGIYAEPMASHLQPHVSSPPLGRPLDYNEYMQRPSHSFTDDPWNFDPFAAKYNSGMNTFAMKYNYDPLGMNTLDKTQNHLDPDQLSYPGDIFTMQSTPNGGGAEKLTQVGGWDKSPDTYRTSPRPPHNNYSGNLKKNGDLNGIRRSQSPYSPNSFNQFQDQSDSASVIKSQSLNLNPLKILSDANPGIEFTIESASNGQGVGETYKGGSNYDSQYNDATWSNYPQRDFDVYDGQQTQASNNYMRPQDSTNHLKHLQEASKYENGNYDPTTQLYTFGLSQDYIPRDRPVSDLSDSYAPHSGGSALSTGLTPPSQTAAMYKRQGSRVTRRDNTPLVELEGLSLFKDILKNEKAAATRSHLIQVLTN